MTAPAPTGADRFAGAVVPDDERARLAAGLGARLAAGRARLELSRPDLAARAGCSTTTVANLERGRRRPRRSMLAALAAALAPDHADAVTDALVALAGPSLRPDTPGSLRRRERATQRARRATSRVDHATPARALPTERQARRMTPARLHTALARHYGDLP